MDETYLEFWYYLSEYSCIQVRVLSSNVSVTLSNQRDSWIGKMLFA